MYLCRNTCYYVCLSKVLQQAEKQKAIIVVKYFKTYEGVKTIIIDIFLAIYDILELSAS